MHILSRLTLFMVCFVVFACPAIAQTILVKSIHFNGTAEYSDRELITVSGFKIGQAYTASELRQFSQRLMDTGLFQSLSYKSVDQDLLFQVAPLTEVYPIHLVNLPIPDSADFEAELRARCPLYHGKVPAEGSLLDDVRSALEDRLKALGIQATLTATPAVDPKQKQVTAMSFSVMSPSVLVGDIKVEGQSPLEPEAVRLVSTLIGGTYDRDGSSVAIAKDLADLYRDKGFLDVEVHASRESTLSVAPDGIRIPFQVKLALGPIYKVTTIRLAPTVIVSQADFDKQSLTHTGDPADGKHVRENWQFIERQYHNRGLMKARVTAIPALDHAQHTVSYDVEAEPGPTYTMGTFTMENVSDEVRAEILAAWKMSPGSVFNEGAIRSFFATHTVSPKLERNLASVNYKYNMRLNEEARTVDLTVRFEKR